MSFTVERVLRTLNLYGVRIPVKRALELADELVMQHGERTVTVENNSYDRGHVDGYALGKRDAEVPPNREFDKYHSVYVNIMRIANEQIPGIVNRVGRERKIQCIKELRNITGLGLKDSKDIVDAYMLKLDAASTNTYYGDEPPF